MIYVCVWCMYTGHCFKNLQARSLWLRRCSPGNVKVALWVLKVLKSDSRQSLKVTLKSFKGLWVDTSKHMVFIGWEPLWATCGEVGNSFRFCLFSERLLFLVCDHF